MRDYGRIACSIWQSPGFRSFSEDGRHLALYLLSCPHGDMLGCFHLPPAYIAEDLIWEVERVSEGLQELESKGFITVHIASKWVFITNFLQWNPFENPNVAKKAEKMFDKIMSPVFKPLIAKAILHFGGHLSDEFKAKLETLSIPLLKPIENHNHNHSLNHSQTHSPVCDGASLSPPAKKDQGKEQKSEAKGAETWAAYEAAYINRYRTKPVRNAKSNSLIAQVVDRLGAESAPQVAAFYVCHNSAFYVRSGHALQGLVNDAEKLHTEWVTGQQITNTAARQADQKQTTAGTFQKLIDEANGAGEGEDQ